MWVRMMESPVYITFRLDIYVVQRTDGADEIDGINRADWINKKDKTKRRVK